MKKRKQPKSPPKIVDAYVSARPRVTIAISVENAARYLLTALRSVAAQEMPFDHEIVIVDNASVDQSTAILRDFFAKGKLQARVIRFTARRSDEEVCRYLFAESTGDYIFHLKGSDFLPDKTALKRMVAFLDANSSYSSVCGQASFVDKNGNPAILPEMGEEYYQGTDYMLRAILRWQSPSYFHTLMYRREAILKRKEYFDALSNVISYDKRLYFHLLNSGRIKVLPFVSYKHRVLESEAPSVYSNGYAPYAKTYKGVCLLEKAANDVYKKAVNFDQAKRKIWAQLCSVYWQTPTPDLKKDVRSILRMCPDKAQYRYVLHKAQIRLQKAQRKDAARFDVADQPSEPKIYTYPFDPVTAQKIDRKEEKRPMVSVGMTVYNQEEYVGRAIESIVSQKVNFDYELVIAEDCSTDRSREIVIEYAKKYPQIKLVLQEHNVGLKEQSRQLRRICKGIYRTHLEGDDYWLTTDRLQKQVDFLETHKDYIAVTGRIKTVDQNNVECDFPYGDINTIYSFAPEYTLQHFEKWLLPSHTGALLYRNVYYNLSDKVRDIYETTDIAGDRKTALFLIMQGRIHCMNEYISVRRIVNSPTNFTAVNRAAHPYSMIYGWMPKLEDFAKKLCNVTIDLSDSKEMQWLYATHFFFKSPSRISLYHVRKIYAMSDEKSLYRQLLFVKMKERWRRAVNDLGFFKALGKLNKLIFKTIVNLLFGKGTTQPKDTSSVLIGHANK